LKRGYGVVGAVAAAAALLTSLGAAELVTATTASAAPPGGCSLYRLSNSSGEAFCPPGEDPYRVLLTCINSSTGAFYYVYGPWVSAPAHSRASCNSGDLLQGTYGGVGIDF